MGLGYSEIRIYGNGEGYQEVKVAICHAGKEGHT